MEKASPDVPSYAEVTTQVTSPGLAETAGRRQSVAVNIVENPLMVSLTFRYHKH